MPFSWKKMMRDLGHPEYAKLPEFPPVQPEPLARLPSEARIGVVTSCGARLREQAPFERINDLSYRVLPREAPVSELDFDHPTPVRGFAEQDLNVAYPRDRLIELEREGAIGDLAPRALSVLGSITRYEELLTETVPGMVAELEQQEVDLALLLPFCPACHRSVCLIARGLEARGIPTVMITLLREVAEAFKPPRVAFLDFPLGATVGRPNDPELQREILRALLGLVPSFDGAWAIRDLDFQWSENGSREWEEEVVALYAESDEFIGDRVDHHTEAGDRLEGREKEFTITCNC